MRIAVVLLLGMITALNGYSYGLSRFMGAVRDRLRRYSRTESLRCHGKETAHGTGGRPLIGLTREAGSNNGLRSLLHDMSCIELPCIEFVDKEDQSAIRKCLLTHDVVVITSPQSAAVFLKSWHDLERPKLKVACVGQGTAAPLMAAGIIPVFIPAQATAATLAKELPLDYGTKVLYPTSALADGALVRGLQERGFEVTRVDTYTTMPTKFSQKEIILGRAVDVVTFASPSAVRNWAEHIGTSAVAVTIGPTSAEAAKTAGFEKVYSPKVESKGINAWADLIREVALSWDKKELYQ